MLKIFRGLREEVAVVFDRDPAARSTLEVISSYPGFHAIVMHRVSHWLWHKDARLAARFNSHIARGLTGIEIHPGAKIGRRFFIDHGMGVVIGETAEIGDDCTLYHGVTLGGTSWEKGKRHPTLEDGVIVGAGAKVLGPITVGTNGRVGSNSVVVRDVDDETTVVGIPGQVVKKDKVEDPSLKERKDMAAKIGFDAYGLTSDQDDPVTEAIHSMLDHIRKLENELAEVREDVAEARESSAAAGEAFSPQKD